MTSHWLNGSQHSDLFTLTRMNNANSTGQPSNVANTWHLLANSPLIMRNNIASLPASNLNTRICSLSDLNHQYTSNLILANSSARILKAYLLPAIGLKSEYLLESDPDGKTLQRNSKFNADSPDSNQQLKAEWLFANLKNHQPDSTKNHKSEIR
ncbi:hypothetical protein F511_25579 [Dorcoceras hygrometricum]|uniref:Uncharacterized protein n=1 Tax=Dorcoceras hygrometricum TaxID=472368 RepID=A0A2Z7AUG5_9LAMI|nr:hypothetical protein F511_25579 [Dorcoceras hygrometricum]